MSVSLMYKKKILVTVFLRAKRAAEAERVREQSDLGNFFGGDLKNLIQGHLKNFFFTAEFSHFLNTKCGGKNRDQKVTKFYSKKKIYFSLGDPKTVFFENFGPPPPKKKFPLGAEIFASQANSFGLEKNAVLQKHYAS